MQLAGGREVAEVAAAQQQVAQFNRLEMRLTYCGCRGRRIAQERQISDWQVDRGQRLLAIVMMTTAKLDSKRWMAQKAHESQHQLYCHR